MKYKTLLSFLLCACCAIASFGQVKPGTTLTYKTLCTLKQPGQDSTSYTAVHQFKVLEKLPDGRLRVQVTLLDYRNNAGKAHFDVARLNETSISRSDELLRLALLQDPVEMILGPDGDVPEQPGLTAMLEKKGKAWKIRPEHLNTIATGLKYYLLRETRAIFFTFPPAGKTAWQSKDSSLLYSVSGAPGGMRHITGRANPAKKQDGYEHEYHFDYDWDDAAGKIQRAVLLANINGSSVINGENKPFSVSDDIHMELVENTFAIPVVTPELKEMSVKSSFWSDAIVVDGEADSTKMYTFFAKFDPLFNREKGYVQAKLALMQRLRTEESYQRYNDSLRVTPNYLLEGNSIHLHNKLQDIVGKDADSAMMLIRYLSAASGSSFGGWIHHSFAQHVTQADDNSNINEAVAHFRKEGWTEERIQEMIADAKGRGRNSSVLLKEMGEDADTLIRYTTYPMYLYQQGKNLHNKDSLQYITQQFRDLPPGVFKKGNAGRYALMLYKKLLETGNTAEAGALLDNTIGRLEKSTADSASSTRFAERNILAYAYKLKYDTLKKTDRKQAFVYLAKAAAASPKSTEENTHDSFYDRALLDSKESYRQDFADELLKEGASQEALMVLSQQITADPSVLPEVQKSFRQHLPDRDFAEFLEKSVMKSWKTAPAFELQGTDGKTYKLSDYAGKWLLLDFWGTWCDPCRRELPNVNAYANSIKDHPEKALLSIACFDTPEKVNALFSKHGYTIPAAMSDSKVQNDYSVRGYPSKFLVSPQGKMIFLSYGTDFQKIMEQFASIKTDDKSSTVSKELR